MKIKKIKIEDNIFNLNLKFYFLLKYLLKTDLTEKQSLSLIELINLNKNNELLDFIKSLQIFCDKLKGAKKKENLINVISEISSSLDINLLSFCLKLFLIKNALLAEAKLRELIDVNKLEMLDPLSLEYDNISVKRPYSTRVNGALIALLFFSELETGELNFISENAESLIKTLSDEAVLLKNAGLKTNQIFMLMLSESINQSIISDSGTNYEDRILSVLKNIGINEIKKTHDKSDSSTEFDFYFELNKKTIGIGAKRTLRERYKQFIKTVHMTKIDLMIEITLGLDLSEEKAKAIIDHGVVIFVSDEVYKSRIYLQKLDNVYSVKELNIKTLKNLTILN